MLSCNVLALLSILTRILMGKVKHPLKKIRISTLSKNKEEKVPKINMKNWASLFKNHGKKQWGVVNLKDDEREGLA